MSVDVTTSDQVTTLTINRTEKLNLLDWGTIADLQAALAAAERRAIILTGEGDRAFDAAIHGACTSGQNRPTRWPTASAPTSSTI